MRNESNVSELKVFSGICLKGDEAAHRQITAQLRGLIVSGELKPGMRFPSMREIAKELGSNYFTVQEALTPLVREGLIERRPKLGTVVLRNAPLLTSVGIYFGAEMSQSGSSFYPGLYDSLFRKLEAAGIEARLFIDSRPLDKQGESCPHLRKAIQNHEIQGVIGGMLVPEHIEWLQRLSVPVSLMTTAHHANSVKSDNRQLVRAALGQLASRGCKTVELLPHQCFHGKEFALMCEEEALAAGVRILGDIEQTPFENYATRAEYGYSVFLNRWRAENRPDGLMVYPDPFISGVITAILELGLKVPEDLKLILYRNREIPLHCPIQADWILMDIDVMVDTMIHQLHEKVRGVATQETWVPSEVLQGY